MSFIIAYKQFQISRILQRFRKYKYRLINEALIGFKSLNIHEDPFDNLVSHTFYIACKEKDLLVVKLCYGIPLENF